MSGKQCDTDGERNKQLQGAHSKRLGDALHEALPCPCSLGIPGLGHYDHKCVTADTSYRILTAGHGPDALRKLNQYFITDAMAEGTVDILEPVHVKNQHGQHLVPGPG